MKLHRLYVQIAFANSVIHFRIRFMFNPALSAEDKSPVPVPVKDISWNYREFLCHSKDLFGKLRYDRCTDFKSASYSSRSFTVSATAAALLYCRIFHYTLKRALYNLPRIIA
jgi:hypothetical protein